MSLRRQVSDPRLAGHLRQLLDDALGPNEPPAGPRRARGLSRRSRAAAETEALIQAVTGAWHRFEWQGTSGERPEETVTDTAFRRRLAAAGGEPWTADVCAFLEQVCAFLEREDSRGPGFTSEDQWDVPIGLVGDPVRTSEPDVPEL